jgi:hypothetical protein
LAIAWTVTLGSAPPGAFVVVVATTTKECRRCGNDDKSRGQPIPQQSPSHRLPQEPRTTPDPDGHGWHNRDKRMCCEEWANPAASDDQGRRLVIEWTANL